MRTFNASYSGITYKSKEKLQHFIYIVQTVKLKKNVHYRACMGTQLQRMYEHSYCSLFFLMKYLNSFLV